MKLFLVFLAVLSLTQADSASDIAAAEVFIGCCRKAMDGGIPSIPIPDHNPLVIRNLSVADSKVLYEYDFSLTNNIMSNLLDFNVTKVVATEYTNPERVAFDYDLYWPLVTLTGNYFVSIKTLVYSTELKGTYSISIHDVDFTGIFNLTKPGQEGVKEHLDEFSLISKSKKVDVKLTGDVNDDVENVLQVLFYTVMNHFPASFSEVLRTKHFNKFWIEQPQRIAAIIENCAAKKPF